MSLIDVRKRSQFKIKSTLLISRDLIPPCENKEDFLKINTKKQIYDQLFVLARIYLYVDNKYNFISFYFDGFPFSYSLEDINPETIKKIDEIYDEEQIIDCIEDDYKQILDQLSRMIEVLLGTGHSLSALMRWAAIEKFNPQNKLE